MTIMDELEEARHGLETLLTDVLGKAFGVEPEILPPGLPASDPLGATPDADVADDAPPAYALLAIRDDPDGGLLGVQVRLPGRLAHALAARMFAGDEPSSDDLLDGVAELANTLGGDVKALLFTRSGPARLSLPSAVLGRATGLPPARHAMPAPRDGALLPAGGDAAATTVRALVHGDVAELTLIPHVQGCDVVWPPVLDSELEEGLR